MSKQVKLVIFTPTTHADIVRKALGDAGAGKIGNYSFCSFSTKGAGRFLPEKGASPAIGQRGVLEAVEEERTEVICDRNAASKVMEAVRSVHPYEEIAYDIYPLLSLEDTE